MNKLFHINQLFYIDNLLNYWKSIYTQVKDHSAIQLNNIEYAELIFKTIQVLADYKKLKNDSIELEDNCESDCKECMFYPYSKECKTCMLYDERNFL